MPVCLSARVLVIHPASVPERAAAEMPLPVLALPPLHAASLLPLSMSYPTLPMCTCTQVP